MLNRAIEFATIAHRGQRDKKGRPMIIHAMRVMQSVAEETNWDTSMCVAAVLHDVVEDTAYDVESIADWFGKWVAARVDSLSRREGETYRQYIQRVKRDKYATVIKLADLRANLDPKRYIPGHAALYTRYAKALDVLLGG
jgi:(p)ppGpp synthase/HD superfamily hydrolase